MIYCILIKHYLSAWVYLRKQQKTRKVVDTIEEDTPAPPPVKDEVKSEKVSQEPPDSTVFSTTCTQGAEIVNLNEELDNDDASNDSFVLPEGKSSFNLVTLKQ